MCVCFKDTTKHIKQVMVGKCTGLHLEKVRYQNRKDADIYLLALKRKTIKLQPGVIQYLYILECCKWPTTSMPFP